MLFNFWKFGANGVTIYLGCTCGPDWSNDHGRNDCSCPSKTISDKKCTSTRNGKICSENGNCICGECQCKAGYTGKYCQKDPQKPLCQKLGPCITKITKDSQGVLKNSNYEDACIKSRKENHFGEHIHKICHKKTLRKYLLFILL